MCRLRSRCGTSSREVCGASRVGCERRLQKEKRVGLEEKLQLYASGKGVLRSVGEVQDPGRGPTPDVIRGKSEDGPQRALVGAWRPP